MNDQPVWLDIPTEPVTNDQPIWLKLPTVPVTTNLPIDTSASIDMWNPPEDTDVWAPVVRQLDLILGHCQDAHQCFIKLLWVCFQILKGIPS